MDGYAVRAADASRAGAQLKVTGEIAAGRPFDKAVHPGEAVRIFTGGVMPEGADAVVIQEDTISEGGVVTVTEAAIPGRHIRLAGIDFRNGDVLLSGGSRLTDRDLSLAAGMNYPELPVRRRPRVALLATGDELVMPGSIPGPGQIVYSNGYALRALARHDAAEARRGLSMGHAASSVFGPILPVRMGRGRRVTGSVHVPRSWPAAKPSSLTSLRRSPDTLGWQRGLTSSKCFDGARSGRRGVVQSEVKEESRARARLGGHERRTAPRRPDPARPSSPSTAMGRKRTSARECSALP